MDDSEDIDVEEYEIEELCEMIYQGKLQDSKTVAALLAYKNLLNEEKCGGR